MVRGVFLCSLQKHQTACRRPGGHSDGACPIQSAIAQARQVRAVGAFSQPHKRDLVGTVLRDGFTTVVGHAYGLPRDLYVRSTNPPLLRQRSKQRLTAFPLPQIPFTLETLHIAVFLDEKGFICYKCSLVARPFRSQVTIPNSLKDKK